MNQTLPSMVAVPLTIAISLSLVTTFVLFFLGERTRRRQSSPERDSLLPLGDERPSSAKTAP